MSRYTLTARSAVARILLATVGGYVLALAFCIAASALLSRGLGLARADAFILSAMLSILIWLGTVFVSFLTGKARRAASYLIAAVFVSLVIAYLLTPLPGAAGSSESDRAARAYDK